jgi:hypothetical protein
VGRDPQDVAEAHRRYQLNAAYRKIDQLRGWPPVANVQDSPSMRLALIRLMVGSHAHRRPLAG